MADVEQLRADRAKVQGVENYILTQLAVADERKKAALYFRNEGYITLEQESSIWVALEGDQKRYGNMLAAARHLLDRYDYMINADDWMYNIIAAPAELSEEEKPISARL